MVTKRILNGELNKQARLELTE